MPFVGAMGLWATAGCSDMDTTDAAIVDETDELYEEGGDHGEQETGGHDPGEGDDDGGYSDGDTPVPPNDGSTPPEDETKDDPDVCDDQSEVKLFLSPDDSNSMSSPVQARDAVMGSYGSLYYTPIRTWEFLNYYTFDYPAADPGTLRVTPSLVQDEDTPDGQYVLQIGVTSEAVTAEARAPMNITLVLDTSGSMSGLPIDLTKAITRTIAGQLQEGDHISIVTWNTSNSVVLPSHAVTGANDPMVLNAIAALEAEGGTDLHAGLVAGYAEAQAGYDASRINRVVLISDGGANVGVTDADLIGEQAGGNNADGIYMVGVGVGFADTYNDDLMDVVTDMGKGASVFVSTEDEVAKTFGTHFLNTFGVAARDVQVELDLPPGFEIVRFSGEEYSDDPSEIEPQHIAPNDTMVFHQHIETCAPELIAAETPVGIIVRYKDVQTFEAKEVAIETTFGALIEGDATQLRKGAAVFEYAEALKAYRSAEIDENPEKPSEALAEARQALDLALTLLPNDSDLAEIDTVLTALGG